MKIKRLIFLIIVVFTIYSLIKLFEQVKLSEVKILINTLDSKWPLYMMFSIGANLFATFAWLHLDQIGELRKVSFWELFIIRQVGESLGQLNPAGVIGGDYLKYRILSNKIDPATIHKPLYLFRIYSIVSFFWTAALSFVIYTIFYAKEIKILHYIVLGILMSIITFQFKILKTLPSLINYVLVFFQKHFRLNTYYLDRFEMFSSQIASLSFSSNHFIPNLLLILNWCIGSFEAYAILKLLNVDIPLINTVIMEYGIMAFKGLGQFIPAQLGVEEVGNSYMLLVFGGFTSSVWLGFSIMRRIRQLFWVCLSFLYLWYFQRNFS